MMQQNPQSHEYDPNKYGRCKYPNCGSYNYISTPHLNWNHRVREAEENKPLVIPSHLREAILWILDYALADVDYDIPPDWEEKPSEETMDEIRELLK
jgi:hypothetical protein